jgi:hypothetical protein
MNTLLIKYIVLICVCLSITYLNKKLKTKFIGFFNEFITKDDYIDETIKYDLFNSKSSEESMKRLNMFLLSYNYLICNLIRHTPLNIHFINMLSCL